MLRTWRKALGAVAESLAGFGREAGVVLPEDWWHNVPPELMAALATVSEDEKTGKVGEMATASADALVGALTREARQIIGRERRSESDFNRRLRIRWGEALDAYRLALGTAEEAGEAAKERYGDPAAPDPRLNALIGLHARACLTGREILDLISHGYGMAAAARWRTLYELSVTAFILSSAAPELSQRYLEHSGVRMAKDALDFQKNARRLGYEPLDAEELDALQRRRSELRGKWGKEFVEDNGWAAPLFGHRPTFAELETRAGIEHLRPYYNLGLHSSHAGARGAELALLVRGGDSFILTGPMNTGFAETASASLISLNHVTMSLLLLHTSDHPSFMALVLVHALQRLSDRAGKLFHDTETQIEHEEAELERKPGTSREC